MTGAAIKGVTGAAASAALVLLAVAMRPAADADRHVAGSERVIDWSGYRWRVRRAAWGSSPGPNRWSARNVSVRSGRLRLRITRGQGRAWSCAEVETLKSFGYGRYEFVVDTDLSHLDPWVVFGLFTYGGRTRHHNEIDFEATRWGDRHDDTQAQLVQQPFRSRGNLRRIRMSSRTPYTIWWEWRPGRIAWGVRDAAGRRIGAHRAASGFRPGGEVVHMNLWLFEGHQPAGPVTIEVSSFRHTPLAEQP